MSKIVSLRQLDAEQRFRERLAVAIAILRNHANEPISEGLLEAIEDLGDDLTRACEAFRGEGRL